MSVNIAKAVGRGAKNSPADVRTVQTLLNSAGANPPLTVGKAADESLYKAIESFQKGFLKHPDGVIEPNKTTWRKLNEAAAPKGSAGTGSLDVAIPVAFPDYLIQVDYVTPSVNLPGFGKIGGTKVGAKIPYLGHAGILFYNGSSGLTKYYEYGRYPPSGALGRVRRVKAPDVDIAADGHATKDSLTAALKSVSSKSGQGGRVLGAYIVLAGKFDAMLKYARKREGENADPKRTPYDLHANSCMHFAKWTAEAGGVTLPQGMTGAPADWIEDVRDEYPDLQFTPGSGGSAIDIRYTGSESGVVPSWANQKSWGESVWDGDK